MGTPLTHNHVLTMLRTLLALTVALTLVLIPPSLASMNKVAPGLWVGNQHAAGDLATLAKEGITAVLNVAWDLDIAYPSSAYTGNMEDFNEHLDNLQYAKVGLVDGDGNPPGSLAAAVLALSTFLNPREGLDDKDKTTFPQPVNAVLLHCHSGQSRSVTVAALYLTLTGSYSTYKAARGLTDNHAVPVHALTALAHKLVNKGFSLNVIPDDSSSSSATSATSGGTTTTATTTSASGGPSSSTTASSGTAAATSTSGSGGGSTADASPAAPAGSSKKSSKASVAVAIVFSIISVMVIAFLIAFALSKRFPDS